MKQLSNNRNWILRATTPSKVEKIEAFFTNYVYAPHRHDTFAIGLTLSGIQSFHYRGVMTHSQPGMTMVIHPDEKHDGQSGTEDGYQYQMLYIEPSMIQTIIGGKPLPFLKDGLSKDSRLFNATSALLLNMNEPIETLEEECALYDLATILCEISGKHEQRTTYDYIAAERAREYIQASLHQNLSLDELEKSTGRDRWSLSRDFRLLFGTSPYRYMTMRRLDIAKKCLFLGESLTQTALISGFFDQSHMTKHFKKTFGLTPAKWQQIHHLKPFF